MNKTKYCQLCSAPENAILNKAFGNTSRKATTTATWHGKVYLTCEHCNKIIRQLANKGGD